MKTTDAPVALVVDDEPAIGWTLERALARRNWRTIVAGTAKEGLRYAATANPSVILLDVRLPDNDGLSVLPQFREVNRTAPVIVMTAFGDLTTALRAANAGADDFLPKPFDLSRVFETIDRVVADRAKANASAEQEVSPPPTSAEFVDHFANYERAAELLAEDLIARQVDAGNLLEQMQRPMERALFRAALAKAGGNRLLAAKWLGVHRATLRARLKALGLD